MKRVRSSGSSPLGGGLSRARTGRGEAAFTMVEIAICIAIVAFALAAIIGVLPTGVRVQRDNLEGTIVNHDGEFWLETVRSGSWGMDELTNYVESIRITRVVGVSTNFQDFIYGDGKKVGVTNTFRSGSDIVGLLTTPKFGINKDDLPEIRYVTAFVRALSGNAKDKPQNSTNKFVAMWDPDTKKTISAPLREVAFNYRLLSEVQPAEVLPPPLLLTNGVSRLELTNRIALRRQEAMLESSLYDVRLTLQWPVSYERTTNRVGRNQKTFAGMVSGRLHTMSPTGYASRLELFHFQPATFIPPRIR
jgi:hypothetical protein